MGNRLSLRNLMVSLFMLPLMIYWTAKWGEYTLIDNADLVIHEAGHIFFFFFGSFVRALGGTLMQILLPLLLVYYFYINYYRTGLQVSLLWLGQNLINISVYAADASARILPLLGGNKAGHDWHYILGRLNLLEYDAEVGYVFFTIGVLVFLLSFLLPLFFDNTSVSPGV